MSHDLRLVFVTCDLGALFSKTTSTRPPTARKGIGAGRLMSASPPVLITICGPDLGGESWARHQQQHPLKPASAWFALWLAWALETRRGSCCGMADDAVFCLERTQLTVAPADMLDDRVAAGHHASDVQLWTTPVSAGGSTMPPPGPRPDGCGSGGDGKHQTQCQGRTHLLIRDRLHRSSASR